MLNWAPVFVWLSNIQQVWLCYTHIKDKMQSEPISTEIAGHKGLTPASPQMTVSLGQLPKTEQYYQIKIWFATVLWAAKKSLVSSSKYQLR